MTILVLSTFVRKAIQATIREPVLLAAELGNQSSTYSEVVFKCVCSGDISHLFRQESWDVSMCKMLIQKMHGRIEFEGNSMISCIMSFKHTGKISILESFREIDKPKFVVVYMRNKFYRLIVERYLKDFGIKWECTETNTDVMRCLNNQGCVLITDDESLRNKSNGHKTIVIQESNLNRPSTSKELYQPLKLQEFVKALRTNTSNIKKLSIETGIHSHHATQKRKQMRDIVVLVVEDNAVIRKLSMKLLNKLGITKIMSATDGSIAVEMVQKAVVPFDIIFMDLKMKKVSIRFFVSYNCRCLDMKQQKQYGK